MDLKAVTLGFARFARTLAAPLLGGLVLMALATGLTAAPGADIAVIYPQVREPFAALYRDYVSGISRVAPRGIDQYAVNGQGREELATAVEQSSPAVFIALGNKSVRLADEVRDGKPLVAVVTDRKYEARLAGGILLKPSADVYLANLFDIHTGVDHVYLVYNPAYDQDMVDEATRILAARKVRFSAIPASNIREAAAGYQQLLKEARSYSAIWLPPDNGFVDSSLLATLLDVAWEKKLIVFSSNPLFVKHGAAFAVYPDNQRVGSTLGRIALRARAGERTPLEPLKDVRLAVNERTVNHLGIDLSPAVRRRIELMLPGR